ncbi:ATP-binding protein [Catenulispora subtropica]|uniref:Schlafen AlbA-2 domain-containing protein n=1 Tax=Catenulispora subtropica TaxID=450798 RepID=A0ABP5EFX0_9ACTN
MSIYLSPDNPRWMPKTESDLKAAIDNGLIEESHHLDAKKEVATKGDNRETARDLASFANDGGTLIIGLAEDKANGRFMLDPQPLNGLPEKIEQIARTIPDPPLNILTSRIESDADPANGYVVVHVPASPAAPHMVDNYYFGRGDKTKHKLSNDDVLRLHQRRRVAEQDVLELLDAEIAEDPITDESGRAHLFLVAEPQAGRPDLLLEFTSAANCNLRFAELIQHKAYPPYLEDLPTVEPSLLFGTNGYRRARGIARATSNLGEGRIFTPQSKTTGARAIELQLFENGGLRLFFTRFSDCWRDDEQFIWDAAAVALTRRFLAVVTAVAEEGGYIGNWSLAIGATGLRGLRAVPDESRFENSARYDRDEYRQATATTWAELNDSPGAIANRLLGAMLRALAVVDRYAEFLKS